MLQYIDEHPDHAIHSILIAKEGKLVFEKYYQGYEYLSNPPGAHGDSILYSRDEQHYLASVTKSITSALVGIAINKGFISNLNDSVLDYLPQYAGIMTGAKAGITLKHLITMTSGLAWDETTYPYGDPRNNVTGLFIASDPVRYILQKSLISDPGTVFFYHSGATNVLAAIVEKTSGKDLAAFAEENLFTPLGITEYEWERFNSGICFASGGLHMKPRDLAKIGYLYLHNGSWGNQQLLTQNWIDESQFAWISTPGSPISEAYGYQWWVSRLEVKGAMQSCFLAAGWGEQFLILLPQENLLIQFNCGYFTDPKTVDPLDLVENYILHAVN